MPKIFRYPHFLWRAWSSIAFILVVISVPLWTPVVLITSFVASRQATTKVIRMWFRWLLWIFGIQVKHIAKGRYNAKDPCLIIANHQSHFDIPACLLSLDGDIRMAAKKELFMIPFFGQCLSACEFICVDRKDKRKSRQAAAKIGEAIRSGIQPWVAAEGTRTKDGELQQFKSGSFSVAIESQAHIQPLVVIDAFDTYSRNHILPRTGRTISIVSLDYVPTTGLEPNQRKELAEKVRTMMIEELLKERGRLKNVEA